MRSAGRTELLGYLAKLRDAAGASPTARVAVPQIPVSREQWPYGPNTATLTAITPVAVTSAAMCYGLPKDVYCTYINPRWLLVRRSRVDALCARLRRPSPQQRFASPGSWRAHWRTVEHVGSGGCPRQPPCVTGVAPGDIEGAEAFGSLVVARSIRGRWNGLYERELG